MSTRRKSVRSAGVGVSVEVSGNHTSGLVVGPSLSQITTVTSLTARGAASHDVLGRDTSLDSLVGSDTESVGHSFGGTESPTGTTVSLISDFGQRLALWPVGSGVETVWGGDVEGVELADVFESWSGFEEGTHQSLDLVLVHVLESAWINSCPRSIHGVDLLGDVSDSGSVGNFLGGALVDGEGGESQQDDD